MWLHSGSIWTVKPTSFANGMNVVCGRKKKDSRIFDASVLTYGMELAFTKRRKAGRGAEVGVLGYRAGYEIPK